MAPNSDSGGANGEANSVANGEASPEPTLQEKTLAAGEKKFARAVYKLTQQFVRTVLYRFFSVELVGAERLSVPGPLIIAPVHRSNLDVLLIAGTSRRRVRSLAKESMFSNGVMTWIWAALGAFPVERGSADRAALDAARMLLDRGEPVLVFPEGTRQSGRSVAEVFDGVGYLAAKTGARVVPVGLAGTQESLPPNSKRPRRSRVHMVVGEIMEAPSTPSGRVTRAVRQEFSAALRSNLQAAQDEANARRDAGS